MNEENKVKRVKEGSSRTPTTLLAVICSLLVVVIAVLVIFVILPVTRTTESKQSDFFDSSAQSGILPGQTPEEIQKELDKIVEEGMFNISIASIVTMNADTDEALVRIENIPANHHNMSVTITLDDTNEVIYQSAGLAPGQYIEHVKFNQNFPAGDYSATALFTAYDVTNLSPVGQAAAKITIVVGS